MCGRSRPETDESGVEVHTVPKPRPLLLGGAASFLSARGLGFLGFPTAAPADPVQEPAQPLGGSRRLVKSRLWRDLGFGLGRGLWKRIGRRWRVRALGSRRRRGAESTQVHRAPLDGREIFQPIQREVAQEVRGGPELDRPPGKLGPPHLADQSQVLQLMQGAIAADTPIGVHLGPGDGLAIGHHG